MCMFLLCAALVFVLYISWRFKEYKICSWLAAALIGFVSIIAMTANVFREDVEKCLAVGMNEHIGKPINFDEVVSVLKEYLT